jgi:hypothetical protein
MLHAASGARPLTAAGQTFDMDMDIDRRPLGDIPGMAEYQVRSTVTRLIPDPRIEWMATAAGKPRRPYLRLADRTSHRQRVPGQQLLRLDQHQRRAASEVPLARCANRPAGELREPQPSRHRDRRALERANGAADAAPGAGDQRGLAGEVRWHGGLPLESRRPRDGTESAVPVRAPDHLDLFLFAARRARLTVSPARARPVGRHRRLSRKTGGQGDAYKAGGSVLDRLW